MKIVTLNIWGGRITQPLLDFLNEYKDIDVFCFQEVFFETDQEPPPSFKEYKEVRNIYQKITNKLKNHTGFFTPQMGDFYGLSIFVKTKYIKNISFNDDVIFLDQRKYLDYGFDFTNNIQSLNIEIDNKKFTIMNIHGLWSDSGKDDNDDRFLQSENIKNLINRNKYPCILCGDYNLNPYTESLKILENIPLKNLIKEYNIIDTRTSYYKKENRLADYFLIDPEIKIKDFQILPCEVSDHAPLYLEIK